MVCIRPTESEDNGSERWPSGRRFWLTRWLEKQAYVWVLLPVPQTNTGTRVEKTQAYERTFAKELGNTATVTSG